MPTGKSTHLFLNRVARSCRVLTIRLLANLITVNGANEKLEIKTSFAILKVNKERFLFKEPFKNKCLFIVAQDTGKYGNQMFRIESSPEQSFDKDGFTISASSPLDDGDSFFYFAIGY